MFCKIVNAVNSLGGFRQHKSNQFTPKIFATLDLASIENWVESAMMMDRTNNFRRENGPYKTFPSFQSPKSSQIILYFLRFQRAVNREFSKCHSNNDVQQQCDRGEQKLKRLRWV